MNAEVSKECINLFEKFLTDIIKAFPEYKTPIYNSYESIMTRDEKKTTEIKDHPEITDFLKRVNNVEKLITDKNDELFSSDFNLIQGISFKKIWTSSISKKTRAKIWKYLQTFQHCFL